MPASARLQLAYAIGVAHPVSVLVDTYGTGVLDEEKLSAIVNECFDMRPAKIIEHLNLRRPIYEQTAAYGHFGRTDVDLPWEHTDMVEKLQELSVSAGRPFASSVRPPQVLPAAGAFYATAGRPGAGPPHLFMARPVHMKFYTVDKRA